MNEQQFEWCRKLHFRKGCFSLLLSLRLSPVAVGFFFLLDLPRGRAVRTFLLPFSSPRCYSSDLLSRWLLFHFLIPNDWAARELGFGADSALKAAAHIFFFPHLILVFFPCENNSEWIPPKNVKSRGNPSLWQLDWYNMSSNRMKRWYDQRWGLFSRLIVKCFDIWLI